MLFVPAVEAGDVLHSLLTAYYREGEDADTPQENLDAFIGYLQDLLDQRILLGDIAFDDKRPVGFVLYALDSEGYPFSESPGMGTIAEIGTDPSFRRKGLGRILVSRAEETLRASVAQMYVCAHASARTFWQKCGYMPVGSIAGNGLPIHVRTL